MIKDFNKIVKILGRKGGNILFKSDIISLLEGKENSSQISKINTYIYRLKAGDYIIPIKSGVYIIPAKDDLSLSKIEIIEKYYFHLLKKYIQGEVGRAYYISGLKSLEFQMRDMSIPEKIYIVNKSVNKKIQVGDYTIIFKTISGNDMLKNKKVNLYDTFKKYTKTLSVEGQSFKTSNLELAIYETALISDMMEGVQLSIIIKAIKKYHSIIDHDVLRDIGKYKYNMSANRLKEITKTLPGNLSPVFLDIIKKNGNCFVGEGLRAI